MATWTGTPPQVVHSSSDGARGVTTVRSGNFHAKSNLLKKFRGVNSLHAEMVCSLPFINAEINVISLRSK